MLRHHKNKQTWQDDLSNSFYTRTKSEPHLRACDQKQPSYSFFVSKYPLIKLQPKLPQNPSMSNEIKKTVSDHVQDQNLTIFLNYLMRRQAELYLTHCTSVFKASKEIWDKSPLQFVFIFSVFMKLNVLIMRLNLAIIWTDKSLINEINSCTVLNRRKR